jgi:hypothetical protein
MKCKQCGNEGPVMTKKPQSPRLAHLKGMCRPCAEQAYETAKHQYREEVEEAKNKFGQCISTMRSWFS